MERERLEIELMFLNKERGEVMIIENEKKRSEINERIDGIIKSVEILTDKTYMLYERLKPIMLITPKICGGNEVEDKQMSDVAMKLLVEERKINNLIGIINDIDEDLEL